MQLGSELRRKIISRSLRDLDAFGRLFMPKAFSAKTPLFQRKIDGLLMDKSIKRKGIIAPRGHAKSTKVSVVFPLHETLFNPQGNTKLIIIISESQSQSIAFLQIISWNLQYNPKIRQVFGNLVGSKWRDEEIETSNGVRILARGTGQRIRGSLTGRDSITRPNLIILDDFESETNSGTPEAIDKNKKWIARAVEPSLADDGVMVAVGTMISERAYLSTIRQDPAWTVLYFQALMNETADGPGDIPIWPERFSKKRLMDIKKSYEARGEGGAFWQEYMNISQDMDRQVFPESMYKYYDNLFALVDGIQPALLVNGVDGKKRIRPLSVTVGVDLAISESKYSDYSVVLVLGRDFRGRRYVLDYWRDRTGDVMAIVDRMFEMCQKYGAQTLNIETVQFQQAVANLFYDQMNERGIYVGIEETKPRTSKDARIRSLQPILATGNLLMRDWMVDLQEELRTYPAGAHDDLLDALYMADAVSIDASADELEYIEHEKRKLMPWERDPWADKEVADWLVL